METVVRNGRPLRSGGSAAHALEPPTRLHEMLLARRPGGKPSHRTTVKHPV